MATNEAQVLRVERRFGGPALIAIGVCLLIGWAVVATQEWNDVIGSHTRLGYLIGDTWLLAPGLILSGVGIRQRLAWGHLVFLITVGVAAFDLTHTFIYMLQIEWPKIGGKAAPWEAYAALIVLTIALLVALGWWEIRVALSYWARRPVAWRELWSITLKELA